jgi:hypothetical protein
VRILHRAPRQLRRRFVVDANGFIRIRRISRDQHGAGARGFPADPKLVFAAELRANPRERALHGGARCGLREIGVRFVPKRRQGAG